MRNVKKNPSQTVESFQIITTTIKIIYIYTNENLKGESSIREWLEPTEIVYLSLQVSYWKDQERVHLFEREWERETVSQGHELEHKAPSSFFHNNRYPF